MFGRELLTGFSGQRDVISYAKSTIRAVICSIAARKEGPSLSKPLRVETNYGPGVYELTWGRNSIVWGL